MGARWSSRGPSTGEQAAYAVAGAGGFCGEVLVEAGHGRGNIGTAVGAEIDHDWLAQRSPPEQVFTERSSIMAGPGYGPPHAGGVLI